VEAAGWGGGGRDEACSMSAMRESLSIYLYIESSIYRAVKIYSSKNDKTLLR
jgi:hypothetical protein